MLCAGALLADFVIYRGGKRPQTADSPVSDGRAQASSDIRLRMGGTSGNTAYGLAKLSVSTMILAAVGDDYYGRLLRDDMVASGVDAHCVVVDESEPTLMNIVVAEESGDYSMFAWPDSGGALWHILPEDVPADLPASVDWIHFCGATLERDPAGATLCALAERSAARGAIVSIDLNVRSECFGWREEYGASIRRVMELSSVVFGARGAEYGFFAEDPRELVTEERMIVVREGRKGCTLYSSEGQSSLGIYDVPVVDTIGAGDAFDSGFIAAAIDGLTPRECLVWANACGNYSVQFEGGRSCPDRGSLERFLEERSLPVPALRTG